MADLFTWETHIDARTVRARTLVVMLGSFVDAGNVQRLLSAHLGNVCANHVLGRFDVDQLVDYREHRPALVFDRDHFTNYEAPEIVLREMTDEGGERFLLLSGVEPALRWEAVAAEVERIVRALDVSLVVLAQGIPMMVPHTRPVAVTRHSSNPELLDGHKPVFGTVGLAAAFPFLLELRLAEAGHDVVGLTAHIPHYLTQTDHPEGAIALMQAIRDIAGLHVPTTDLAVSAGVVRAQIALQLADNEELQEVVGAMEEQYDQVMAQRELTIGEADLPSADEIGAEAEKFLQGHHDDADQDPGPEDPDSRPEAE